MTPLALAVSLAAAVAAPAGDLDAAWFAGGAPSTQARALAALLAGAADKGLDPEDYDGRRWPARLDEAAGGPEGADARARTGAALTASALRYLRDLASGRVRPRQVRFELDPLGAGDPAEALRAIAGGADPAAVADALEPPFAAYRRTRQALGAYRALAAEEAASPCPPGDVGVDCRLRRLGDLDGRRDRTAALACFQRRHGLPATGRLDPPTRRQLERPLAERARQLVLTLERWRWLPRRFPSPPVVVNVPEFQLHAGDPGARFALPVVVGRAYRHQTPVFTGELRAVVLRPPWRVPLQIQREEIAPRLVRDPGYLARESMEVLDAAGAEVGPLDPVALAEGLRSGALRLRQRPGPRSALGLVKFEVPNVHDVYLHDTPSQELFRRSRRDFSHGCIRVEDPFRLAAWLLRDRPEWTPERLRASATGAETVRVPLPRPVPVLILYGTAVVAEGGEVRFYDDLYGHDAALARALAARQAAAVGG